MKRILSVLLIAALASAMTGCSFQSKISSKKLAAYAEQYGATVYDDADEMNEDVNEHINSEDLGFFSDGIAVTTDDAGDIVSDGFLYEVSNSLDSKSVKEVTFFMTSGDVDNDVDSAIAFIYALDYESNEDAAEAYEDMIDYFEDELEEARNSSVWEVESDSGKSDGITYSLYTTSAQPRTFRLFGYYLNGTSVMFIGCMGSDHGTVTDLTDDLCKDLGVKSPGDL
ncbi:MAG: hypothetical protein J5685_11805 [Clostridiales bacterium]|nr:hypothetical protein [Clostridiales bacterium]